VNLLAGACNQKKSQMVKAGGFNIGKMAFRISKASNGITESFACSG
jgi:hypothetical protein